MSYIQVSANTQYDPLRNTIIQNGKESPAGFAGVVFAEDPDVQAVLREAMTQAAAGTSSSSSSAGTAQSVPSDPTPWSPYSGPADARDAIPSGGGLLTASGAPEIQVASKALQNAWNYQGPAAENPYYTTSSNPLRSGYVEGYDSWFESVQVNGVSGSSEMNPEETATEEGAQEALRLVQQFEPDATLTSSTFGAGGGPWQSDMPVYGVALPNGITMNAGLVLSAYYNGGEGVTAGSDARLSGEITQLSTEAGATFA